MTDTYDVLQKVVDNTHCLPGWSFRTKTEDGALRLVIRVEGYDSSYPSEDIPRCTDHFFPAPIATYNYQSWRRWIFECCRRVMNHELGEWFCVDGVRPFQPLHGPGEDPYTVHEFRDTADALTTQDGTKRRPYEFERKDGI